MASVLSGALSRLIPGVFSRFGKKDGPRRAVIVTLVTGCVMQEGGMYLRGKGMPESSARFISWANLIYWAHKPDGKVARRWKATQRETNPDYPRVYADTVRALQFAYPETWERSLAVLGLKPPTIDVAPEPPTISTDGNAMSYDADGAPHTEQPDADEDPSIYEPKWTPKADETT